MSVASHVRFAPGLREPPHERPLHPRVYGLQALAAIAVILFIIGWAWWTVMR